MATTVSELEKKVNAAIAKYDLAIATINSNIENLKTTIEAQDVRDADNARNLLQTANDIAKTAKDACANLAVYVEGNSTDIAGIRTDLNAAIGQIRSLQGNLMGTEPEGLQPVDLMKLACKVANITEFNDPEAAAAYQIAHNQLIQEFIAPKDSPVIVTEEPK